MRRAPGRDRLGPGSEEAWPAAQTQIDACLLYSVLRACHAMLFLIFMPHAMPNVAVSGAQDPEIGPTRLLCLTNV